MGFWEKVVARARKHCCLTISIVFAVIAVIVGIMPFMPVNIYYRANFNDNVSAESASFIFDSYDPKPSLSTQSANIDGATVSIRVDPVNFASSNMSLGLKDVGDDAQISSIVAVIRSGGRDWCTVATLYLDSIHSERGPDGVTFDVNEHDFARFVKLIRQKSALKAAMLVVLGLFYVLIITRLTVFRNVRRGYFVASGIVVAGVVLFLAYLWFGRADLSTSRFPYKTIVTLLVVTILALIGVNYRFRHASASRRGLVCLADYAGATIFAIGQFLVYLKYYSHSNDEMAHLSYVAYERVHNQLLPAFENIRIYADAVDPTGHIDLKDFVQFNQLGHPPLYYLIMSHMPGISNVGTNVTYHLGLLRCESFCLGLVGILLCFYMGYTRVPKIPLLHLVFALIIVSPPNLIFIMSGLNNDTLAFTCVTVFVFGCVRFVERRYTKLTFFLIALGISSSLLTKLTAGMVVCFTAVVIVAYALLRERDSKALLRKEFAISLPIYAVPLAYYAMLIKRYGTVQPSYQKLALSEYLEGPFYTPITERQDMSLSQYVVYYWTNFTRSWCSFPYASDIQRPTLTSFSLEAIAITCTLLLPIGIVICAKTRVSRYISFGVVGMWLVSLYQFWSALNGFYRNGYTGAFQSRYYLCVIVVFAFAIIALIWQFLTKPGSGIEERTLTSFGSWICGLFVLMLMLDGYILSFLYHAPELTVFAG